VVTLRERVSARLRRQNRQSNLRADLAWSVTTLARKWKDAGVRACGPKIESFLIVPRNVTASLQPRVSSPPPSI
jgi:hypothetical protein